MEFIAKILFVNFAKQIFIDEPIQSFLVVDIIIAVKDYPLGFTFQVISAFVEIFNGIIKALLPVGTQCRLVSFPTTSLYA